MQSVQSIMQDSFFATLTGLMFCCSDAHTVEDYVAIYTVTNITFSINS